jgi:hypothetical protein
LLSSFLEELTEEQRQNIKCVKGDGAKRIDACIKKAFHLQLDELILFRCFAGLMML